MTGLSSKSFQISPKSKWAHHARLRPSQKAGKGNNSNTDSGYKSPVIDGWPYCPWLLETQTAGQPESDNICTALVIMSHCTGSSSQWEEVNWVSGDQQDVRPCACVSTVSLRVRSLLDSGLFFFSLQPACVKMIVGVSWQQRQTDLERRDVPSPTCPPLVRSLTASHDITRSDECRSAI